MNLYGPYKAKVEAGKNIVNYVGNNVDLAINDISKLTQYDFTNRVFELAKDERYFHLHKIDNAMFFATIEYFKSIGADWCNLPLTTLMISSPGEVYAGQTLDYTTDTLPVDTSWFNNERKIFLSESSQFYLELRLLVQGVDKVFSIYNSFRKENADFSHLSEFQHIEFEGHVDFQKNINISIELLAYIADYLVKNTRRNLEYFLTHEEISSLSETFKNYSFETLTFKEALSILYKETKNPQYKEHSLKHFGSWEEIKLTELIGKHAIITEYPILEIPFYHNEGSKNGTAENADIVLYGYREVIGSGVRITNGDTLLKKSKIFNLPEQDYAPYLESRQVDSYQTSAGFGMGWQRFTHWLLKLPTIVEASHIPRGHWIPKP